MKNPNYPCLQMLDNKMQYRFPRTIDIRFYSDIDSTGCVQLSWFVGDFISSVMRDSENDFDLDLVRRHNYDTHETIVVRRRPNDIVVDILSPKSH